MAQKKQPKPVKASTRQRKYVKGVIEGKSARQAARDAGYAEQTAARATVQIENKPVVAQLFKDTLETAGLTDEKLALRLNEGVDAMETKFFAKDGEVTDQRDVINHAIRQSTVATVLKIKGHLRDKVEVSGSLSIAEVLAASFEVRKGE